MKKINDSIDLMDVMPDLDVLDLDNLEASEIASEEKADGGESETDAPEIQATEHKNEAAEDDEAADVQATAQRPDSGDIWESFINEIEENKTRGKSANTLLVGIDVDLCHTIDECLIDGVNRSQMVNAALRCFIKDNLDKFASLRKQRKSLLD